ncbi:MAG: transporter substrate-binding domain-containing protein [Bacteroidales bacterium]|nr:transporter substrate-binding domain-containing protein [Bacteroidales bacterium]
MKKLLLLLIPVFLFSCNPSTEQGKSSKQKKSASKRRMVKVDLDDIIARDTLKAIMTYSSTSYFLYRGQAMGYEYELLKRLADHLDLHLKIVIAPDMDKMFNMLQNGKGDLIAHGMTITRERKENFRFTEEHTTTHQVLVQRKPENWRQMKLHNIRKQLVSDPLDLIGKTVHVRENSSYYDRLQNLMDEIGGEINIISVPGNYTTEDLVNQVASGKIDYTVADYNIASINKTYNPILDIDVPVSFSQRIAWMLRKNSPQLLEAINEWIVSMRKQTDYYVIYNKYFKNKKDYRRRIKSDFYALSKGKISKYDDIVKQYADTINWDWRLLSSLIYQESKFNPKARSWVGAQGLMQMMPATAKWLGYSSVSNPKTSVEAGAKYLKKLENNWQEIPEGERKKFVMASYNAGPNHVADARRLTKKYGGNPNIWYGEVDEYLLKLSSKQYFDDEVVKYGYCRGSEPYKYVREIFERFEHYKKFTDG